MKRYRHYTDVRVLGGDGYGQCGALVRARGLTVQLRSTTCPRCLIQLQRAARRMVSERRSWLRAAEKRLAKIDVAMRREALMR